MSVTSTSNRAAVEAKLEIQIKKTIEQYADDTLRIVQDLYRQPKTGKVYRIGSTPTKADRKAKRRFRSHRASAPGEAPAIDTGALRKGTTRTPAQKVAAFRWAVTLGITGASGRSKIAVWLELGTRQIKPRPAWRVALSVMRSRGAR